MGKPYKSGAERPAPAPVVKLEPTRHDAAPIPFTFNEPRNGKPKVDIGGFAESSNSSLSLMKSLGGLEDDELPLLSGGSSPVPMPLSPVPVKVKKKEAGKGFVGRGKADLDGWKGLGLDLPDDELGVGDKGAGEVKLATGKKRLGMGRPAPWGAKRARGE
jgi:hypothetical protein